MTPRSQLQWPALPEPEGNRHWAWARAGVLLLLACTLLFGGFFVLGRAVRAPARAAPSEGEPAALAGAPTQTPVPARLGAAAAIAPLPVVVVVPKPHARKARPVSPTPALRTPTVSQPPAVVSEPAPAATPTVSSPPPKPSKPKAAPRGGGGTSFDSSG